MAMMLAVVLSVGFGSELSWIVVIIGGVLLGVITGSRPPSPSRGPSWLAPLQPNRRSRSTEK